MIMLTLNGNQTLVFFVFIEKKLCQNNELKVLNIKIYIYIHTVNN